MCRTFSVELSNKSAPISVNGFYKSFACTEYRVKRYVYELYCTYRDKHIESAVTIIFQKT